MCYSNEHSTDKKVIQKVSVVWTDQNQTSHNILLRPSLILSKNLTLFNSKKAARDGKETAEEKPEARRGGSWSVKKPCL